jgi:hypothetical protein
MTKESKNDDGSKQADKNEPARPEHRDRSRHLAWSFDDVEPFLPPFLIGKRRQTAL